MSRHIPYFDFYPADFMNGVRGLSAQEVGVYTMLLCRIYEESGPIEYHVPRLAAYCGMRESSFEKATEKLILLGKISLEHGHLSNRRAEEEISNRADKLKINSRAGKKSAEKKQQNQHDVATDVQRTFNHTDTDTDTTLSSVVDAPSKGEIDDLQGRLLQAIGEQNIQGYAAIVTGPIIELIAAGVDLEIDILPSLRAAGARMKHPARSWTYFVPGIREAYERRIAAVSNLPKPVDEFKNGAMMRVDGKFVPTTERRWAQRIESWQKTGKWETAQWGPAPGSSGCTAPKHLLEAGRVAA